MPALVAGIHVFSLANKQDVDGRDKPGHDEPILRMSSWHYALEASGLSIEHGKFAG